MTHSINLVADVKDRLGESPLWDPAAGALFRVDSVAPCIHHLDPATGDAKLWKMPSPIGSIGLGKPGHLIAALQDGFYDVDLADGARRPLWTTPTPPSTRLNDGKMDRAGRYLCGTMQVQDGAPPGVLYRLHADGRCETLDTGIGVSNGLCFSPAGDWLYFTDSRVGMIWAYPYDTRTGQVGARQDLADCVAVAGSAADGATVDADGYIWAALVRTGQLARFTPDGRLDCRIDLPVPHPTCPAFGGDGLDVLYITSISQSGRIQSTHPEAGRLVALSGLGVRGLPEARFGQ
jgi:sugar lactone lactonase YvrE